MSRIRNVTLGSSARISVQPLTVEVTALARTDEIQLRDSTNSAVAIPFNNLVTALAERGAGSKLHRGVQS